MRRFLLLFLLCVPAFANSSNISGSGTFFAANYVSSSASGGSFSYSSWIGDAPAPLGFCQVGQLCNSAALPFITAIPIFLTSGSGFLFSQGCLGSVCTGQGITGNLAISYKFSFITPNGTGNFQMTVPISVFGALTAIGNSGQKLWKVNVHGRGTAILGGYYDGGGLLHIEGVDFTYNGKASVVPEPGTWVMLMTGLTVIIDKVRRSAIRG